MLRFFFSLSLHEEHFDSFPRTNRYFSFFCFHIDGRSSRRSRSGILANKNRIGDGDEILCRVKQRVREFIQEGKKRKISFPRTESDRGLHPRGWRVKVCIDHDRTTVKKNQERNEILARFVLWKDSSFLFSPARGWKGNRNGNLVVALVVIVARALDRGWNWRRVKRLETRASTNFDTGKLR